MTWQEEYICALFEDENPPKYEDFVAERGIPEEEYLNFTPTLQRELIYQYFDELSPRFLPKVLMALIEKGQRGEITATRLLLTLVKPEQSKGRTDAISETYQSI